MKPKQLANVLIKILGLSMFVHYSVPALESVVALWRVSQPVRDYGTDFGWHYFLSGIIPFAIGIAFMFFSRPITELLFQNETE